MSCWLYHFFFMYLPDILSPCPPQSLHWVWICCTIPWAMWLILTYIPLPLHVLQLTTAPYKQQMVKLCCKICTKQLLYSIVSWRMTQSNCGACEDLLIKINLHYVHWCTSSPKLSHSVNNAQLFFLFWPLLKGTQLYYVNTLVLQSNMFKGRHQSEFLPSFWQVFD